SVRCEFRFRGEGLGGGRFWGSLDLPCSPQRGGFLRQRRCPAVCRGCGDGREVLGSGVWLPHLFDAVRHREAALLRLWCWERMQRGHDIDQALVACFHGKEERL